jgi:hypothetical protein
MIIFVCLLLPFFVHSCSQFRLLFSLLVARLVRRVPGPIPTEVAAQVVLHLLIRSFEIVKVRGKLYSVLAVKVAGTFVFLLHLLEGNLANFAVNYLANPVCINEIHLRCPAGYLQGATADDDGSGKLIAVVPF